MQHFQAERFSEEVSRVAAVPKRLSINHMYEKCWLHLAGWATEQGIDSRRQWCRTESIPDMLSSI